MDINQLAKYFSQICGILALPGLVFYLPLKPHWSKRFSFFDAILFYCGIGAPALYLYFLIVRPEGVEMTAGVILTGLIVGGGFAIAGVAVLIKCWTRCSNPIEVICLPFIMLMMIGVFCLGLLFLMCAFVGIFQKPYFTWDSFE